MSGGRSDIGRGNWNRAGRRSGGDRPIILRGGKPLDGAAVLGPCCVLGKHDICEGCDCKCHDDSAQATSRGTTT